MVIGRVDGCQVAIFKAVKDDMEPQFVPSGEGADIVKLLYGASVRGNVVP